MSYQVKINVFEGPFDLLLHLVRVNEMDIYDISIAEITRQYLACISEMETLDLDVAGDFLVMAATLINIKSRTLMPAGAEEPETDEEPLDEETENIRSAQDLMRRLIEYRQFKELAVDLSKREEEQLRLFYRNSVLPRLADGAAPAETREDISLLFSAFARVLEYTETRPTHHVLEEEFSVEEKMEILKNLILLHRQVHVNRLFLKCINKQEAITLFLALLELCKLNLVRVQQRGSYQEIYLVDANLAEEDDD